MEGNRQSFFKKRPNPLFKKGGNKRGKFGEQSSESSQASETIYRILCQSRKIGSVIGKGGGIVKALREETQAKITVADSVPGSEERVIIIYSPSTRMPVKHNTGDNYDDAGLGKNDMELHCAAQDALLKVHEKIVEEDIVGGTDNGDDNKNVVIARLLVPNNTVGCLLGKKGDVIQRLRSETGASIRVLPADQLPACATSTDELVQISAKPAVAKRALYEVSTLLHQNPRKDKPPSSFLMPVGGQRLYPPGPPIENIPPANLMLPERGSNARGAPLMPWLGGYGSEPSRFGPDGFDGEPAAAHGEEAPTEFSMKILCSAAKIGGVIGKGGSNVRQLQQETGTSIHVDASAGSDERVIHVSSFEALWNPRSRTIDAILLLQDKTSDHNEKGIVTTRLLIPSSKVGCILGQGGQVINEMRRRTKADIRVYSKEEKPKCAGEDEELVQVSGNYGVAKDALAEVASRFRARCLRDAKPGTEPAPVGPVPGFAPRGNLPGEGPSPSGVIRGSRSGGYEPSKGVGREYGPLGYPAPPRDYEPRTFLAPPKDYEPRSFPAPPNDYEPRSYPAPPREYEPHGYPVPPRASGYPGAVDVKMPSSGRVSGIGPVHNTSEVSGTRLKLQDPYAVSAEPVAEMRGSSQYVNATHGVDVYQGYTGSGGQNRPLQVSYHDNYGPQRGPYSDINSSSHTSYHSTSTSTNPHHPPYPHQQGHYGH